MFYRSHLLFFLTILIIVSFVQIGSAGVVGDALVLTPQGLQQVWQLKPGDLVTTYDEATSRFIIDSVETIITRSLDSVVIIATDQGSLKVSPDQPVYELREHVIKPAGCLQEGDVLFSSNLQAVLCKAVQKIPVATAFYELVFKEVQFFFVSTDMFMVLSYLPPKHDQDFLTKYERCIDLGIEGLKFFDEVNGRRVSTAYTVFNAVRHTYRCVKKWIAGSDREEVQQDLKDEESLDKGSSEEEDNQINDPSLSPEQRDRALREKDLKNKNRLCVLLLDDHEVKHHWNKVVPDQDPQKIIALIHDVMETGEASITEEQEPCMVKIIGSHRVVVTYQSVREFRRIRNGYVQDIKP